MAGDAASSDRECRAALALAEDHARLKRASMDLLLGSAVALTRELTKALRSQHPQQASKAFARLKSAHDVVLAEIRQRKAAGSAPYDELVSEAPGERAQRTRGLRLDS